MIRKHLLKDAMLNEERRVPPWSNAYFSVVTRSGNRVAYRFLASHKYKCGVDKILLTVVPTHESLFFLSFFFFLFFQSSFLICCLFFFYW